MTATRSAIVAVQDQRSLVDWYFLLKASPYFTMPLLRLGVSANATTVLWGVLNVGAAVLVYRAIVGDLWLVPFIFVMFAVTEILDTSDGEIARFTGSASPIGGKLLDGICHKLTEFALLIAYVGAAHAVSTSPLVVPAGLALLVGEGMLGYCYERRLLIIRVYLQSREKAGGGRRTGGTFVPGTPWIDLPVRDKVRTITGLVSYKSVYAAILVAAASSTLYVWALAVLAAYKHASWIRLVASTVRSTPRTLPA
jgi:phosphatidylglycerophosphate synthase